MIQTFFIEGTLPGYNEFINAAKSGQYGARKYTQLKAQTEEIISYYIRQNKIKPCMKPVHVRVIWNEPNKKRDRDNIMATIKSVLDSLRLTGTIRNDTWKWVTRITQTVVCDPEFPGVRVWLEEAAEIKP